MKVNKDFVNITLADFLARAAYQMGKTPLLPIFAASLGAGEAFLGVIVSVSTMTGMILKPFVGLLSDRGGRRRWLIIGTLFFALMPFVYRFVTTPQQLLAVRLVHGFATAIYGPVTLAYIAEMGFKHKAERLGWFGLARSGGYIVGPALAGWLLLYLTPEQAFTVIGLIACLAFVPLIQLPETNSVSSRQVRQLSWKKQVKRALRASGRTPAIWLAGGLEAISYIGLYAVKAFLPLYAVSIGIDVVMIGLFFSVQEAANAILKPAGGRIGDRYGSRMPIVAGMILVAASLPLMLYVNAWQLLLVAILSGCGQALIFPNSVALVANQIDPQAVGTGMGVLGTLQNGGKVIGPILGGLLITQFGYEFTFWSLGSLLLVSALALAGGPWLNAQPARRPPVVHSGD